jgi:hypothetical protein
VTKISQLSSIGDSLAIGDQFLIRDIDDAGSPNKSVTVSGITRALADGDATAPALAFAADKNTGIYRVGTDSLAVATNGTGRLFVDASGNVGLGVLNPTSTANGLDISSGGLSLVVGANNTQTTRTNATTKTSRIASFHYTNTEEPVAIAVADSTATSNVIYFGGSTSLCNAATELIFYTAANNTTATGSERLRITSAGLVGIGTSSPDERLHVKATGTQRVDLAKFELAGQRSLLVQGQWGAMDIGTSNGILQYTSGNLGFRTSASGNANMLLDISGRVGIGTTSPQALLHLAGSSSQLLVGSGSTDSVSSLTINASAATNFGIGLNSTANTGGNFYATRYLQEGTHLGGIWYSTSTSELIRHSGLNGIAFHTGSASAGSERARLDSSGRLLVGTSTAFSAGGDAQYGRFHMVGNTASSVGHAILALGRGEVATTITTDEVLGYITFSDSTGNTFASIHSSADAYAGAGDYPGRLTFSTTSDSASSPTERLRITSTGQVRLAGAGITFNGDTAAANELDDYEEGTFTPSVGGDATYTSRGGTYTKIGRKVSVAGQIVINTLGTGSATTVSDLPFVSSVLTPAYVGIFQNLAINVVFLLGTIPGTTSRIDFTSIATATATAPNDASVIGNGTRIDFAATYFV